MQPRQVSVSVQEEVNRAVIALSLIKHFKNFLWKGVALLLSLTCLLPSPVTQKKQRTKALQKTNSFCSASIYIRCWNPQPSLPDTSGKCISSTRPIMHHHGGVGGRVGTDRRIIILRGRKKLRGSLTAKYIFSYFRSLCNSRSMKKAEEGDTMESCEQVEDTDSWRTGLQLALQCPLSIQWLEACQEPGVLLVGQCLYYSVQYHSIHLKWQRKC